MSSDADAERYRAEGNKHFGAKHYRNAIQCYTKSLECALTATVLSNRAQAFLNTNQYEKALMDARKAVELDPESVKALYRHSLALIKLGLYEQGRKDLHAALKLKPKNEQVESLLESIADKKEASKIKIHPVEKCETIRSSEPMQELNVKIEGLPEELPGSSSVSENEVNITENDGPTPPVPRTSYQFLADFGSLATRPEKFAKYLLAINTDDYKALLDDVIETDMITSLIAGCSRFDVSSCVGGTRRVSDAFVGLSTVEGFSATALFLSSKNKDELRGLLKQYDFDSESAASIRTLYDL